MSIWHALVSELKKKKSYEYLAYLAGVTKFETSN